MPAKPEHRHGIRVKEMENDMVEQDLENPLADQGRSFDSSLIK